MFYVYVYRDPRPNKNMQPVYVGKGSKRRAWKHWRSGNTLNKPFNDWLTHLRRIALPPVIEIVAEFEDEAQAMAKECELVALYGRRDLKTGPLFNCTHGGDGVAGLIWTEPYRAKHLAAIGARDQAAYQSLEFKQKVGAKTKEFWQDPDYRERTHASMKAAQSSHEARARKSAETSATWRDPDVHAKRVAGIKASRTPELRAQIGASCKALWDEQKRAEQSAKMKAALASPEAKAARSAMMKALWADPAKKAARLEKYRRKRQT